MSADQISVKLTMADELSSKAKESKAALKQLETEMKGVREELARTGKGANELERLENEYRKIRTEVKRTEAEARKLRNEVRQTGTQASRSAHQATTAWQRFRKTMGSGLVTGASIAGIVYFGKRAVEAFAEAEKGQLALQLAMQKFPAVNNVTAASFAELNRQLMNTTGADDDLLASAEGVLARFKLTGSQIQQLIPLVNDYAIATGKDVPTAAASVGKALMGNARALKELGINFSVTGNRSTDLANLMGALESKVGGVGEAFGQTTAGKVAIATANFQNLQEEIGAALVPALEGLIGVVKPAAEWFAGLSDNAKKLAVAMGIMGAAALVLGPRILALRASLAAVRTEAALTGRTMSTGFLGVGKGARGAALGVAALAASFAAVKAAQGDGNVYTMENAYAADAYAQALRDIVQPGAGGSVGNVIAGIADAVVPTNTVLEDAHTRVSELDAQMAKLVQDGNASEAQKMFIELTDGAREWGGTVDDVTALLPQYNAALGTTATQSSSAAVSTNALAAAQRSAKQSATALSSAIDGVSAALQRKEAMTAYQEAMKAYVEDPTAETAAAVSQAMVGAAQSMTKPKQQAKFVAGAVTDIKTVANDSGLKLNKQLEESLDRAKTKADGVTTSIQNIPLSRTVDIFVNTHRRQLGDGAPYASGGLVTGPGTGTSDSIAARLSNGEYVVRAAAVRAMGVDTLDQINRADREAPTFIAPQLVTPQTGSQITTAAASPVVNIGEIHADTGVDVQAEVLWALRRAERIRRERSAA